jgi:WbqC-like protein
MHQNKHLLISTSYLPPIEYMAKLCNYKNIIVEKHESYPKQTYRNRCRIMTANGELNLTIPVVKVNGNNTKTKDIQIINSNKWQLNHWRAIVSAYSGSPFFLYYKDDLEEVFFASVDRLVDYNMALTLKLCELIGIGSGVTFSESFTPANQTEELVDLRFSISPKNKPDFEQFEKYIQVFSTKYDFTPNLSIIDLLFNLGPETKQYLTKLPTL